MRGGDTTPHPQPLWFGPPALGLTLPPLRGFTQRSWAAEATTTQPGVIRLGSPYPASG
jgi:hypothetical protein